MRGLLLASAAFGAIVGISASASATITIYEDQPGAVNPDENVQFNDGLQTNPFTALTNQGTSVTFLSDEALQSFGGGQTGLTGQDDDIQTLTFFLTDLTKAMTEVEFILTDPNGPVHTTATISFYDQFDVATTLVDAVLGQGNDFFAAATDGSVITKVVITTAASIEDVRQIRLSVGDRPPVVPEPATWAMMIAGFGLVGGAMRVRRREVTFG